MAFSHTLIRNVTAGGNTVNTQKTYSADARVSISDTVANGATDDEAVVVIDSSRVISLFMNSTQNMTVESDSGTSPTNTIELKANVPYIWNTDDYNTNIFYTDITNLYRTNVSGSSATFSLEVIYDAN
jgi:hypothetical protein